MLNGEVQAQLWELRRQHLSIGAIGRSLGVDRAVIRNVLWSTGGIEPPCPRRARAHLKPEEREEISRGLSTGKSFKELGRLLKRAPSTISREVRRNGGRESYRAVEAEAASVMRRRRPKPCKLRQSARLREIVEQLLAKRWSPMQISRHLRQSHPGDPSMNISHEAIYLTLYIQGRGELRRELTRYLRQRRWIRQAKGSKVDNRGRIPDMIKISQRPPEVADRAVPGHWEGDILKGSLNDGAATLVERTTRYTMLARLPFKPTAEDVRLALTQKMLELPEHLRLSLTWDRGKEMVQHTKFTIDTGIQIYFCDPASPWQRGTNENTNGLLRDYYPKGKSFRGVTQDQLDAVAHELNNRPRQTLGWMSPARAMAKLLADTGSALTP